MADENYLNIPNDSRIGIICSDISKNILLQKTLQNLGLNNFQWFERGSDLKKAQEGISFELVYILGSPKDMSWHTFIRIMRTGKDFSAVPLILIADPSTPFAGEDKQYLMADLMSFKYS